MKLLLASPPIHGHILSILGVAEGLASRGHDICVLAGQKYRGRVEAAGARFLPLPAAVDFDDADLDAFLPGRADKRGIAALRHDLIGIFMSVVPAQYRALRSALATESFDAVITELVFGGTLPYLLTTPRHRDLGADFRRFQSESTKNQQSIKVQRAAKVSKYWRSLIL